MRLVTHSTVMAESITNNFTLFPFTICGIEEIAGHRAAGVSHVLSILDPEFPPPPAFGSFGEHERLDLRFNDIIEITEGRIAPQPEHVEQLLAFGRDLEAEAGAHLLVHCHMGISRSTASAALMMAQAHPGHSARGIFGEIVRIRPQAWPNLRIVELGDALLGRRGELVEAVHEVYRARLAARPELKDLFIASGRGREVRK